MYFNVQIILHHLAFPLLREDGFSMDSIFYINSVYYIICDDYGVNADKTWVDGDRFYMATHDVFGDEGNATKRSTPDKLTR